VVRGEGGEVKSVVNPGASRGGGGGGGGVTLIPQTGYRQSGTRAHSRGRGRRAEQRQSGPT
jgi:hypothetical protein